MIHLIVRTAFPQRFAVGRGVCVHANRETSLLERTSA